ncbi:MAG: SMEK domain-containing protein [Pseudomonadales bacterium]|nr:SMEK domain-containing protein [Pseudomonadales bacterium]
MNILDLQNEFRELIARFRQEIEAASAMTQFDAHQVAENVICGLLRELCDWPDMHNLNADQANFPGIDLADDTARVAVQVTATADIGKIKHTIDTFIRHNLHEQYDRLVLYVLTAKQGSYSQSIIETACQGKVKFSSSHDVWDYRELCAKAAEAPPKRLQAAVDHLKAHLRGVPIGLADEDIDPPNSPAETLTSNLIDVWFPPRLYVAQINQDLIKRHGKRKEGRWRKTIRELNQDMGVRIPSAYVIHSRSVITFFDLTKDANPFRHLIELGTAEEHSSQDFFMIDDDHERVFKSLLRFSLQHRLARERVHWESESKEFIFLPREDNLDQRTETWEGAKKSTRTVFTRQYNKKDPSKVFTQKHLSFSVDFLNLEDQWLISITPNWYFSYGRDFRKSPFGQDNLSWIKRQENNQQVRNHFRFIAAWLLSLDEEDLFSDQSKEDIFISFGEILSFDGAPALDESRWAALPSQVKDEFERRLGLFE